MIHVGLCADDKFALPLGVCLTSIFESNKDIDIKVHLITQGLSSYNLEKLNYLASFYQQHIEIYKIDDSVFDNLPVSTLFPKSIYFRYLFSELVSKDIKKLLYMDCDTIILGNLNELYSIDMGNYALAVSEDRNGDDIIERNRIEIFDGTYFNSGVMLMNLDYWRENKCFSTLISFIKNNPKKCKWPDQDALNVLYHNKSIILSPKYNFLISFFDSFETIRLHKKKWAKIIEASKEIVILHYATKEKPWYSNVKHPLVCIWRYFFKISPWSKTRLHHRVNMVDCLADFYKYKILGWNRYELNNEMEVSISSLIQRFK